MLLQLKFLNSSCALLLCMCGCQHSDGIILACVTRLQVEHVLLTQSSWRKIIPTKGGFASACMRT